MKTQILSVFFIINLILASVVIPISLPVFQTEVYA